MLIPNGHDKISNGCAALGNGVFASVSRDLKLRLWNIDAQHKVSSRVVDTPHNFSIKCIAALPSKQQVATGSYGGLIAIYDCAALRWILTDRPTTAGISSLSIRSDNSGFIGSSYDGKVHHYAV